MDQPRSILDLVWIYLVLANVGSFSLMGFDKLSVKMKSERIPELWFVVCSLAGGLGGIFLGMLAFHHKVSKTRFQLKVRTVACPIIPALLCLRR